MNTKNKIYIGSIIVALIILLNLLWVYPTFKIEKMYNCKEGKYRAPYTLNNNIKDASGTSIKYIKLEKQEYGCTATAVFNKPMIVFGSQINSTTVLSCNIRGFNAYAERHGAISKRDKYKLFKTDGDKFC